MVSSFSKCLVNVFLMTMLASVGVVDAFVSRSCLDRGLVTATSKTTTSTFTLSQDVCTSSRLYSTVIDEPATIEKTDFDQKTTPDKAEAGTKLPAFLLRLWNDPYNKRELYVPFPCLQQNNFLVKKEMK